MREATLEERLWSKIDRRGPDECWPWTAGTSGEGYGYIRVGGRIVTAHRLVLILDGRDPGPRRVARHTCDNPPCCNPSHLIPGRQADNMDDMSRRGRGGRKLDAAQAAEIRARLARGETQRAVATDYGVSQVEVGKIGRRVDWKHAA